LDDTSSAAEHSEGELTMGIVFSAERAETFVSREVSPHELEELAHSQLEHASTPGGAA
jgi:hypothetical protein